MMIQAGVPPLPWFMSHSSPSLAPVLVTRKEEKLRIIRPDLKPLVMLE